MRNSIRCCISCILPCGALDVIRIVHSNGRVEELTGSVKASEIMKLYPKHVLKKPSSSSDDCCPKIVVVPPDAELQRGKIYFLMPLPPSPEKSSRSKSKKKKKKGERYSNERDSDKSSRDVVVTNGNSETDSLINSDDRYLTEILSENKASTQRDRRRGRAAVWRPHLESICETPVD